MKLYMSIFTRKITFNPSLVFLNETLFVKLLENLVFSFSYLTFFEGTSHLFLLDDTETSLPTSF